MKISTESLLGARRSLDRAAVRLSVKGSALVPPVTASFSPVIGLSEAGAIHGRALAGDPNSAQEKLRQIGERISAIAENLASEAQAFDIQDEDNARGLDVADQGGEGTSGAVGMQTLPTVKGDPFAFLEPIVNVGPSLHALAGALEITQTPALVAAAGTWTDLAAQMSETVALLGETAASLAADNDSVAVSRAVEALQETAAQGGNFVAHAGFMANQATSLAAAVETTALAVQANAAANAATIGAPGASVAYEQAVLAISQQNLQAALAAGLPHHVALTDPLPSRGGGDVETGRDDVEGTGQRYNTDGVAWPQSFVQAVADGRIGPGSFEVVDGQVTGLNGVGDMSPAEAKQVVDNVNALQSGAGRAPGIAGMDAAQVGTQAAGFNPGGSMPVGAGQAYGSMPGAGSGTPGLGVSGAGAGGLNGVPGLGGFGTAGAASGGAGAGAAGARGAGGAGAFGVPGLGGLGGAGGAGSASGVGAGRGVSIGGVSGGVPGGVPGGAGGVGAGTPGTGAGTSGVPGAGVGTGTGTGAGGPASGGPAGAQTASNHVNTAARGPMAGGAGAHGGMGTAGRRGDGKKVRSVTSRYEANRNRRELLGKPKPALRGAIGSWVRETGQS